jgi:hypothetical protein
MWAVGGRVNGRRQFETQDRGVFVAGVVGGVGLEIRAVNRRVTAGSIAAGVASGMTVLTFVLAFTVNTTSPAPQLATISLNQAGQKSLGELCNRLRGKASITGELSASSLQGGVIEVAIPSATCSQKMAGERQVTLHLKDSDITGVATLP